MRKIKRVSNNQQREAHIATLAQTRRIEVSDARYKP